MLNGMNYKFKISMRYVLILVVCLLCSCSANSHRQVLGTSGEYSDNTKQMSSLAQNKESTHNNTGRTNTTKSSLTTKLKSETQNGLSAKSTKTSTTTATNKQQSTTQITTRTEATQTTTQSNPFSINGKNIVGYYAGWSSYSGFTPDKIKVSKLTHVNYAFAKIDNNLKLALSDSTNDTRNFALLQKAKANNESLKTLISVGGWDYSKYFSDVALTSTRRTQFAQSCLDFILTYGFDGIDIDWEYPVSGGISGNINRPEDKQNFTYLLQTIRDKLNNQSEKDGKKYYLTIAGGTTSAYINKIELYKISSLVDYIFLMGYDMHGLWDKYADFNAPLYKPTETSPQYKISVNDAVNAYLSAGLSPSKLVLGMPFYAHIYRVNSNQNNGLFSLFTSSKSISYNTVTSKYLGNSAYKQLYHSVARVPYLYGNNTFISYENALSIAEKVQLATNRNLGGVGAWELSQDRNGVLLNSAYTALR